MKPISVFEYLLIISPSQEIKRYVNMLKRIFADRYGCTIAASSAPHITMGNWGRSDYDQAKIITSIGRFAETISPFIAHFDGLGNFKPETIFVNVFNKEPFTEISKGLKESTRHFLEAKKVFPTPAHLTIARSMEPDQFERAWSEWKDEAYEAYFPAKEMILLRRPVTKEGHGKYQTMATFPFLGKSPLFEQLGFGF